MIDLGGELAACVECLFRTASCVRELAAKAGAKILGGDFLDFLDPWGNRIEVVEYADLQFTESPSVLHAMSLHLPKTEKALDELHKKGMG